MYFALFIYYINKSKGGKNYEYQKVAGDSSKPQNH